MNIQQYYELFGFEQVYLEDSYVKRIVEEPRQLLFELSIVLTERHQLYQKPEPDEQYCYRSAVLKFPDVNQVVWHERKFQPYTDASGSVDYGNIDTFYKRGDFYYLEGDWGSVTLSAGTPILIVSD